jgi:hypothetical protein
VFCRPQQHPRRHGPLAGFCLAVALAVGTAGAGGNPASQGDASHAALLPDAASLPGYRLVAVPGPDGRQRATLTRRFRRDADGAILEFEAVREYHPSLRDQRFQEIRARLPQARATPFSGLPVAAQVAASAPAQRGTAVLALAFKEWVFSGKWTASSRETLPRESDLWALERAGRMAVASVTARTARPVKEHGYVVGGRRSEGLHTAASQRWAPVVPLLQFAGLRVEVTRELGVVRAYREQNLAATLAPGASGMRIGADWVASGSVALWVKDGELHAPVAPLAASLGLCTYLTVPPEPAAFHVARKDARRPQRVMELRLPPGDPDSPSRAVYAVQPVYLELLPPERELRSFRRHNYSNGGSSTHRYAELSAERHSDGSSLVLRLLVEPDAASAVRMFRVETFFARWFARDRNGSLTGAQLGEEVRSALRDSPNQMQILARQGRCVIYLHWTPGADAREQPGGLAAFRFTPDDHRFAEALVRGCFARARAKGFLR